MVSSCPRVECSDTEFATDGDDWCMRVNFDETNPGSATVKIRECKGETKHFCDFAKPG